MGILDQIPEAIPPVKKITKNKDGRKKISLYFTWESYEKIQDLAASKGYHKTYSRDVIHDKRALTVFIKKVIFTALDISDEAVL